VRAHTALHDMLRITAESCARVVPALQRAGERGAIYNPRLALPTPPYPTMIRGSPDTEIAILSRERYGYNILGYVDERVLQKVVISKDKTTT
jgi:hypothetical protein